MVVKDYAQPLKEVAQPPINPPTVHAIIGEDRPLFELFGSKTCAPLPQKNPGGKYIWKLRIDIGIQLPEKYR